MARMRRSPCAGRRTAESPHPQRCQTGMTCPSWTSTASGGSSNVARPSASRGAVLRRVAPHAHVPPLVHGPPGTPQHPWRRGGPVRLRPSSCLSPAPGSAQGWSQLAADRRPQAITVRAPLACNCVPTQSARAPQEGGEAHTTPPCHTAPGPLDSSRPGLRAPGHAPAGPRQHREHGAPGPARHPGA
jgi:hypothetical protein